MAYNIYYPQHNFYRGSLAYFYYPPFRDSFDRHLPKDIVSRALDIVIPILTVSVIAGILSFFFSGRKKKKQVVTENAQRLGIQFHKTEDGYFGEYKGRKLIYQFSDGKEKNDYAVLTFFHQRLLNLGLYLLINQSKKDRWILTLRQFFTHGFASKRITLPMQLQESGVQCWVIEEMIGKQLMLNHKIITPLFQLNGLVQKGKGQLLVDDASISMWFPYDTLLDNSILEIAYQLSTTFTNSIMLPQEISTRLRIWRTLYKAVYIIITIGLIVYWGWSIISKFK